MSVVASPEMIDPLRLIDAEEPPTRSPAIRAGIAVGAEAVVDVAPAGLRLRQTSNAIIAQTNIASI